MKNNNCGDVPLFKKPQCHAEVNDMSQSFIDHYVNNPISFLFVSNEDKKLIDFVTNGDFTTQFNLLMSGDPVVDRFTNSVQIEAEHKTTHAKITMVIELKKRKDEKETN